MSKRKFKPGDESVSNGYIVVKLLDGTWRYKHHIVAEEKLKRKLAADERVVFLDKNNRNFDPDNLDIRWKAPTKKFRRRAHLRRRILEARARLNDLEQQLKSLEATMDDGPIAEPQEGRGGRPYTTDG